MESVLWKGGGLLGIVAVLLWVANFADKQFDTKQLYRDLWGKGTPVARLSVVLRGGDKLFRYLFENKKGKFSWWRSAFASLVACLLLTFTSAGVFVPYIPIHFGLTLVSMVFVTIVPDALSLLETRWLIKWFVRKDRGLIWGPLVLAMDLMATTAITVAFFPLLVNWGIALAAHCVLWTEDPILTCWWENRWLLKVGAVQYFYEHAWRELVAGELVLSIKYTYLYAFSQFLGEPNGAFISVVGILTGYITSFWLWLTVVGSWLAGAVRWLNDRYGYSLIARLEVEEHPCVSLVVLVSVPLLLVAGVVAIV